MRLAPVALAFLALGCSSVGPVEVVPNKAPAPAPVVGTPPQTIVASTTPRSNPPRTESTPENAATPSIIGKWRSQEGSTTVEFSPRGSVDMTMTAGGTTMRFEGTYSESGGSGRAAMKATENRMNGEDLPIHNPVDMRMNFTLSSDGSSFVADGNQTFVRD